jgi:hypothetical protein
MKILYFALLGFGIIFAYIKYIENKNIYFPAKEIESLPSLTNIPFEDVYIKTADEVKINGWFMPYKEANYTLLFFHGNAGNIGHRLEKINILRELGVNIFIIDYRGYGKSEGKPSEKGFYLDAQASYRYLVDNRKIRPQQIILYAESLGTAIAIDLASKFKVRALIIEGAFSSGKDMARRIYPFIPNFIFSNMYDSTAKIKNIEAPKLFLHAQDDEVVPLGLAKKLYSFAYEPKEFVELTGGHNQAFLGSQEQYQTTIRSFLNKLN